MNIQLIIHTKQGIITINLFYESLQNTPPHADYIDINDNRYSLESIIEHDKPTINIHQPHITITYT